MGNVHVCGINIYGKELHRPIKNTKDFTVKQIFDITEQLVINEDEINGLDNIIGERIHGDNCHWLVMKQLSIFSSYQSSAHNGLHFFKIMFCVMVRSSRNPNETDWDD